MRNIDSEKKGKSTIISDREPLIKKVDAQSKSQLTNYTVFENSGFQD